MKYGRVSHPFQVNSSCLRCSVKSYLIQDLSKSCMCEHKYVILVVLIIFLPRVDGMPSWPAFGCQPKYRSSTWFLVDTLFNVFLDIANFQHFFLYFNRKRCLNAKKWFRLGNGVWSLHIFWFKYTIYVIRQHYCFSKDVPPKNVDFEWLKKHWFIFSRWVTFPKKFFNHWGYLIQLRPQVPAQVV